MGELVWSALRGGDLGGGRIPALVCDSTTYIFYCFEDQASHDALNDLFLSGLAKWAQAFRRSSVVFAADTACGADYLVPCLCSTPGVQETTLHIIQGKRGEMWPFSTLGYTKPSIDKVYPTLPRHFIQWPTNAGVFNARGPLFMAQQIGEAPRRQALERAADGISTTR